MASSEASNSDLNYADTLWKAADALRGQVDAAEYKHIVLGLLFLKYISDSFESRRDDLRTELTNDGIQGEQLERLLESRDEYTAERVFWVPHEARWVNLQNQATRSDIASLIDDAILAVERDNANLKGKLPRDYARRGIEPVKMKGLIDLIAGIGFKGDRSRARDMLGRVYEYFLGKFAAAEGKLGGEFYTPRSVVRVLVEMLEPYEGRIYDPACGSGGMFVQSEKFVEAHGGQRTDVSIFGQESNPTTWRLAHMNLAIHGIEAKLGEQPADTFLRDQHPDLKADFILANPPFNVSDWSGQLLRSDKRWVYGDPPVGNANYAWIQHFIHHLAYPNGKGGGVAGFVMANGSLSSNTGGEGDIRRKIIEADLVDCIVALPAQLFFTTAIPVCLWFLTRDKTGRNIRHGTPNRPGGRKGETLFIDARKLGTMQTRVLRVLTGVEQAECIPGTRDPLPASDVGRIVYAYRRWRGEPAPDWWSEADYGAWSFASTPGFAKSATLEEIAKHGHVLTPGRYVGAEEQENDAEPFAEKYPRLIAELEQQLAEGERLANVIRRRLSEVSDAD
ncbi:TPA: N-6 DNA methylase [Pseudomonas aeruginosa]|uniref:type I restriction-modification system subunit M n=1 Tax=Pseudomonas aeruginosa TaxID=287 RepID=UPI00071B9548|nr:class I SAM-dependent DNA methyltransferase [Pseudomonas aeruginosa]KSN48448.1 restriction endonuclease subunit M [Pseudomonas aeruginosa]MBG5213824.1 SAM-dependent DNA methyltransferase [Pseudomonas aeruginosa]MBX5871630.1 SAM-dependent DNA methyltransferase [Pseudomonas aeruginosa]MCO4000418.1 SAM-dependent DNA methyltransferase [Pseudomonas aeruginosa]MCV0250322.1 type I restriction-modification system subunit M [Pseudomonas aeruginosa]